MPNWKELLGERTSVGSNYDVIRRKYLRRLAKATGRNVIAYYSGWLQKPELDRQGISFGLNDNDKNGFMAVVHKLDRKKGLDLILHTPGGSIAATESLVDYLRTMFGTNIRAIIPQIAMSAGTMIAMSCKTIIMGKHSSLGPIDPQLGGLPAHGVVEEFDTAKKEIKADPDTIPVWQAILSKYDPSMIGECQKAIAWADSMVQQWLLSGMFDGDADAKAKARKVAKELGDHALTLSHSRHVSFDMAQKMGLAVERLEDSEKIQDLVLSVHHAFVQTLTGTAAFKITENNLGVAFINSAQQMLMQVP
jgi:hypothetical protein